MFLKTISCWVCAVCLLISGAGLAGAVPIEDVIIGARYSVTGIGANREARVARVDLRGNRVLVIYDDNQRTQWVTPDRLLQTEAESFANDAGETVAWAAVALCLLSEECRNGGAINTRNIEYPPESAFEGTSGAIRIENACQQTFRMRLSFQYPNGSYHQSDSAEWTIGPGARSHLNNLAGDPLVMQGYTLRVYAYPAGGTGPRLNWDVMAVEEDRQLSGEVFRRAKLLLNPNGDRRLLMICE